MRVFVTGVGGQLGHDVVNELLKRGHQPVGSDILESVDLGVEYHQLDITDKESVNRVMTSVKADAVIHCAAWTAVDLAEDVDKKAKVYAINVSGTQNIAEVCGKQNIKMMYISTDYVFNGEGTEPWKPDCREMHL